MARGEFSRIEHRLYGESTDQRELGSSSKPVRNAKTRARITKPDVAVIPKTTLRTFACRASLSSMAVIRWYLSRSERTVIFMQGIVLCAGDIGLPVVGECNELQALQVEILL